jgi:3-oxoacyl-[acyl-carrier-protein] synthase II
MEQGRRVVITGMGAISPIGLSKAEFWKNLLQGRSGVSHITLFDASSFATRIAAEVKDFDPLHFIAKRKMIKVMMRDMQFAVAAAKVAIEDSQLNTEEIDPLRFGVVIGAGLISTDFEEISPAIMNSRDDNGDYDIVRFGKEGMNSIFPLWLLKQLPNMLASHISIIYGCQGPSNTITTGCASSANAVGEAFRIITRGGADVVIAGGASSRINPTKVVCYHKLGVLSQRNDEPEKASRPFDARRDGFVIGEGGGIIILEEIEHARARGSHIYGEITGYGCSSDILAGKERIVKPESKARAIRAALKESGMEPVDIDYISAHGYAIPFTDVLETEAIKQVWGEKAYAVPVSSIKGQIGDLGPASGVFGLISAALAMDDGVIPCTANYEVKDPKCDLDYVPNKPRKRALSAALCNSFDFMGQNVSLVIRKVENECRK